MMQSENTSLPLALLVEKPVLVNQKQEVRDKLGKLRSPDGRRWRAKNEEEARREFWGMFQTQEPHKCWKWQKVTRNGYGRTWFKGKTVDTHVLSWIFSFGAIPKGLWVLHKCDNPLCCNPSHLFLGTPADNSKDCVVKGRATRKLSIDDVKAIRARYRPRDATSGATALAKEFGVHKTMISRITKGKAWFYIP